MRLTNDGQACNLVEMDAYQSADGDSGGPVYWGDRAFGLHQGWVLIDIHGNRHEVFSRADLIDEALESDGVEIAVD